MKWHFPKLRAWHWWAIALSSPVWLVAILLLAQLVVNNVLFAWPTQDSLSLEGRQVLVDRSGTLVKNFPICDIGVCM